MIIFYLFLHLVYFFNIVYCTYPHISSGDDLFLMGSTYQMQQLLQNEIEFVQELKIYLKKLKEEFNRIEHFLNITYTKDFSAETLGNLEEYVSHPINAYGVIKRTNYKHLNQLNLNNNTICDNIQALKNLTKNNPTEEDHYSAASSLALLQVICNMPAPRIT